MLFFFNMLNHNPMGQRSLEDVIGIIGHQLKALGHEAIWDIKNDQFIYAHQGINVIVEGFTPTNTDIFVNAKKHGCRFIILATEEPSNRGFNQGTQLEMARRQQSFPKVAQFAEAILHLVPGEHVTKWYSQFAPTSYIELGFAPSLVRPNDFEPVVDFGFYGSLTSRRHRILKTLARRCSVEGMSVRVVADFPSQAERDRIMREARVIVQIRKFERMGLVSSSRCNTALCLGRPVVAEPHLLCKPWDEVVSFADTDDHFFNLCMMAKATWRYKHSQQFERFVAKFPPQYCIGDALERLGILDPSRVVGNVA